MANVLINENSMTDIANAIRTKLQEQDTYYPSEMSQKILSIPSSIPTPYTKLSYIQSSGAQYIDTGIKAKGTIRVDVTFENTISNPSYVIFGGRTGSNSNTFALWYGSNINGFRTDYYTLANRNISVSNIVDRYEVYKIRGATFVINSNNYGKSDIMTDATFTSNYNVYLFAMNNAGSASSLATYRLYSCKIYDGSILVRDFIPVKDPNNIVCLYDKVSGSYFYNQGSGNFVAGPEE